MVFAGNINYEYTDAKPVRPIRIDFGTRTVYAWQSVCPQRSYYYMYTQETLSYAVSVDVSARARARARTHLFAERRHA